MKKGRGSDVKGYEGVGVGMARESMEAKEA